jgi:uncharacterized membrane protein YfcA
MTAMILSFLIFAVAALYSSVGQAGASGYIAAMALFGVPPGLMKPSALVLNILVASLATFRFYRAGHFSWRGFLPLAVGSVPLAYVGGIIDLPDAIYRQVVGVFLLFVAYRVLVPPKRGDSTRPARTFWIPMAVAFGAGIGLLAGLTGIGGGIFLAPVLMLTGQFDTRESSGISAAFILVNSLAAIAGCVSRTTELPSELVYWAIAAVAGGMLGSELAIKHLGQVALRRLLALVLVTTGVRLIAKS